MKTRIRELTEKESLSHGELSHFKRLINEVYPKGNISIVSDAWDFWKVIYEYLPALKDEILARDGRVVIRPDSGDPVNIICGARMSCNPMNKEYESSTKGYGEGAYKALWDIFGGTTNDKGYKVLNPKIGLIYGDSITQDRQKEILKSLEAKGFTASNLVLGIGSHTYQHVTRDTHGFAMKATWGMVNGKPVDIFKDPKTDDGVKKSAKGLLMVIQGEQELQLIQEVSQLEEHSGCLETVFENGKLVKETTLSEIRQRINDE